MALITICGYPCSGKTKRAEQIKSSLYKRICDDPDYVGPKFKVVIVSDDTLKLGREVYNGKPPTSRVSNLLKWIRCR
jgi:protein KTI12